MQKRCVYGIRMMKVSKHAKLGENIATDVQTCLNLNL